MSTIDDILMTQRANYCKFSALVILDWLPRPLPERRRLNLSVLPWKNSLTLYARRGCSVTRCLLLAYYTMKLLLLKDASFFTTRLWEEMFIFWLWFLTEMLKSLTVVAYQKRVLYTFGMSFKRLHRLVVKILESLFLILFCNPWIFFSCWSQSCSHERWPVGSGDLWLLLLNPSSLNLDGLVFNYNSAGLFSSPYPGLLSTITSVFCTTEASRMSEVSNKSIYAPTDPACSPSRHTGDCDCSRTLLKIASKKSCSISLVLPGLIL